MSARDFLSAECSNQPMNTGGNSDSVPTVCPPSPRAAAASPETDVPCGESGREADRDRTGRFVRGNRAALVHGAGSEQFWSAVQDDLTERRRQLLADCGCTEADAPKALGHLVDGALQAIAVRDGAFTRIAALGGPLTLRGRNRAAFTVWRDTAASALKHLSALASLSFDRRAKQVPSLAAYLETAARTAAQTSAGRAEAEAAAGADRPAEEG